MVCAYSNGLEANLYVFWVPFFASVSACSFPIMLIWALTLYMVVVWVRFCSILVISLSMVLSAWLFYCVGCFICVLITYIQLRQSVKMCAGSYGYLAVIIFSIL